jgi:hypothetical protein
LEHNWKIGDVSLASEADLATLASRPIATTAWSRRAEEQRRMVKDAKEEAEEAEEKEEAGHRASLAANVRHLL